MGYHRAIANPCEPDAIGLESRLERGLATMAYIVLTHGEIYAPLFDRLEKELIATRQAQSPQDRARRYLEVQTLDVSLKAIR